ncbi:hypothetical protein [Planctomycetes bacterium Poly30]
MNTKLFLSLALALPMFASCDGAVDAASKAGDSATAAAKGAMDKAGDMMGDLKNMDLSSLSMDAIKEKAGQLTSTMTEKLGSIKDVATAEKFKETFGGAADMLSNMKDKLGASLPGMDSLKSAVENLKSQFGADSKVMEVLKPMLEKLSNLFN